MFEFLFKYPRDLYARSSLTYTGEWPDWLPYVLATIAVLAIAGFLYTRRRQAAPALLVGIGLLQLAMVAVVLWMLALPALETEELREGENAIALVLDTSESMGITAAGTTRLDDARELLAASLAATAELEFRARRYVFDDGARPVETFDAVQSGGAHTAIGASLRSILEGARQQPLAAVIVASDGADTSGGVSAEELAELSRFGVPVHAIAVGRQAIPEDLELTDVVIPSRVLPDSTVTARVTIRHDAGTDTRIRVYSRDELLASVPVSLDPRADASTVDVEFELTEPGPQEIEFSLETLEAEPETRNNRRARLVDVLDSTYRVLYFEGEPRWEYKFMRRAVGDGDIRLETLLRVSPNKFYRQGIDTPESLADGFPATREELFGYDALIIGSVEAATLTPEQQVMIRDFVSERGGSLLMLGGRNGLGNGGWAQTVVADALPTRLPASAVDSFRRVKTGVELTPQGSESPMLSFAAGDDDNTRLWSELPDIADYQLVGELKPAAVSLLQAQTTTGPIPLLVTQAFGRGRSYILATGGTWRWQMSLPVDDQRHEVFWRQLMRTLVASAPPPTSMTATAAAGGSGIELRAEFRDAAFEPVGDVRVSAVVASADGDNWTVALAPSAEERGVYTGSVDPGRSGTYFAEAVAVRDDDAIDTARASLVYETGQNEYFGIRSNPALLSRIASATGGSLVAADDIASFADRLRFSTAGITETEIRPIWDAPALFLLLLLLKAGEWLLRRSGGSI